MNDTTHSPRKVLFILPALSTGGAERVLITLMNHLDRTAFTPELLTIRNEPPPDNLIAPDIAHHSLHASGVVRGLPHLFKALRRRRPDIVVTTMAYMNFALLALRPFFPQTSFIVREAITPSFLLKKYPKSAPLIRLAYRRLYARARCIVSPADTINEELAAITGLGRDRFVTLPNPVSFERIRAHAFSTEGAMLSHTDTCLTFVAAGRLGYQKGFDRLIEALAHAEFTQNWHLTILGEGSARDKLQSRIDRLGLSNHIHMPGLYSNPWPAYANADAFILPSRYEGLPNVVLEALACGTPVIAMHEAGGIHEIASSCTANAVTICNDIHELVEKMTQTGPAIHKNGNKNSLLSGHYATDRVTGDFQTILRQAG